MDYDLAREIMVDSQIRPNDVTDPQLVAAFMKTPREVFVPEGRRGVAYSELEIVTSPGRALWIPRDTAKLMKMAEIRTGETVLVIGAGAGYEAALIAHVAGKVVALEEGAALTESMAKRFEALGLGNAGAVDGPIAAGCPAQGPFDVIYVAGMVETLPDAWAGQLKEGGRLVAVVRPGGLRRQPAAICGV
jgi:protein-L-isoaspartate(D-aspartate) O-methyltransferase